MNITSDQIQEAKKKLGDRGAIIIAKDLGMSGWENEHMVKSIFKNESTPSMHWHSESCMFKCFATQKKYDILDHYMNYYKLTFREAVQRLFKEANVEYKESDIVMPKQSKKENMLIGHVYPKDEPENDRAIVEKYMAKRGISPFTLDFCNVNQDANGNVAFQFIDSNNEHISTKYRVSRGAKNGEMKWWWQSKTSLLYGVNRVNPNIPLCVTEGLVDRLSCVEAGYSNTVSIDGGAADTNWVTQNWDLLQEVVEFIIFADDDAAGKKMSSELPKKLGEIKCKIVRPSIEVKESIAKYYKNNFDLDIDKVDANNVLIACGANELMRMIENAEPIPNDELIYLMDVEDEDITDMEKISTGYNALDEIIYGSFMGCFTILSGKTGSGKSTIANQLCVLSPLECGYKTFLYSGELPDSQIKNWLVKSWAGLNHQIPAWENNGNTTRYIVTKEANKAISKFYRNSLILFHQKNGVTASPQKILDAMEYAYKRNGVKWFEIDNLMVIDKDDPNDNLWEAQKKFALMLLHFTNKYNVNVTLVAHPHKISKFEEVDASAISGAAELGNLCHRLLWVDYLKDDKDGYNSKITVLKDRTTGRAWKSCRLNYDARTMRLYSQNSEKIFEYAWSRNAKIVYDEETTKKLACNSKSNNTEVFGSIAE